MFEQHRVASVAGAGQARAGAGDRHAGQLDVGPGTELPRRCSMVTKCSLWQLLATHGCGELAMWLLGQRN